MMKRVLRPAVKTALILLLLAAALLPAKYINDIYGYLPFLGIVFLLACSALSLLAIKRRVDYQINAADVECTRGDKINVTLKIVNRSLLVCPKARAYLFISDMFGGDDSVTPTLFTMAGKSSAEFRFDIRMAHIGVYRAGLKKLQLFDPLGLFSVTLEAGYSFEVTVLPRTADLEELALEDRMLTESQNMKTAAITDGFDYTGIREYALGDPMKRIHWKLSAHSAGYMTKITESSRRSDLTIALDFSAPELAQEALPGIYDCLVETALSFIGQAVRKDIDYALIFADQTAELLRVIPKGPHDYAELIRRLPLLTKTQGSAFPDGAAILERENRMSNKSSNVIVCTALLTDQLLQGLVRVRQQQRNPLLYYVLPSGLNSREREQAGRGLRLLDEYGVNYFLPTAEAE